MQGGSGDPRSAPQDFDLHLLVDNYATHKHPRVQVWLRRNPRFHVHFTPSSSSWMNMVERFFRDLTEDVVRQGRFTSTEGLSAAIFAYLEERNLNPTRYEWRTKGADILAKTDRAREKMELMKQSP